MPDLPLSESVPFLASFAVAIGASAHCAGMCGGFILAASSPGRTQEGSGRRPETSEGATRDGRHAWGRPLLYLVGKSLTYVFLGSVAWAFGAQLIAIGARSWQVLSIVVGTTLILLGGSGAGWFGRLAKARWSGARVGCFFSKATAGLRQLDTPLRPLYLGVVSGYLPCPLVYAFLARATVAGSFLEMVMTMLALGIGSSPILLLLVLGGRALSPTAGARWVKASAWLLVALGVWTICRGFGAAPCCLE